MPVFELGPQPARVAAALARRDYPATAAEVIDDSLRFRPGTVRALRAFADVGPWTGPLSDRKAKLRALHEELCRVYGKETELRIPITEQGPPGSSGTSSYTPFADVIVLRGRLSVVTYLHEFAHALGKGERGACRWSLNLFKRTWPRKWARLRHSGHTVRIGG